MRLIPLAETLLVVVACFCAVAVAVAGNLIEDATEAEADRQFEAVHLADANKFRRWSARQGR